MNRSYGRLRFLLLFALPLLAISTSRSYAQVCEGGPARGGGFKCSHPGAVCSPVDFGAETKASAKRMVVQVSTSATAREAHRRLRRLALRGDAAENSGLATASGVGVDSEQTPTAGGLLASRTGSG